MSEFENIVRGAARKLVRPPHPVAEDRLDQWITMQVTTILSAHERSVVEARREGREEARQLARGFVIAAPTTKPANSRRLYSTPDKPIGFPAMLDTRVEESQHHPQGTVANTYSLRDAILYWLDYKFESRLPALAPPAEQEGKA